MNPKVVFQGGYLLEYRKRFKDFVSIPAMMKAYVVTSFYEDGMKLS